MVFGKKKKEVPKTAPLLPKMPEVPAPQDSMDLSGEETFDEEEEEEAEEDAKPQAKPEAKGKEQKAKVLNNEELTNAMNALDAGLYELNQQILKIKHFLKLDYFN